LTGFDERYETLRGRFVTRCAEDLAVLEQAQAGGSDPETLRATVHRLAGAAGTFGYPQLSELAGVVDDRLLGNLWPTPAELNALVEAVRVLTRA
jgi:HPt (histidine-containing phosphotransfer) domain-containing protein